MSFFGSRPIHLWWLTNSNIFNLLAEEYRTKTFTAELLVVKDQGKIVAGSPIIIFFSSLELLAIIFTNYYIQDDDEG